MAVSQHNIDTKDEKTPCAFPVVRTTEKGARGPKALPSEVDHVAGEAVDRFLQCLN